MWKALLAYGGPSFVVGPRGARRIPIVPRSPHPFHIARAHRVARGLVAQLNRRRRPSKLEQPA